MRRHLRIAVLACLLAALIAVLWVISSRETPAIRAERDRFRGTWKLAEIRVAAKQVPDEQAKGRTFVFDSDNMYEFANNLAFDRSVYRLRPDKSPKEIDIIPASPNARKLVRGIYELEGDELTICWSLFQDERPSDFSTPSGTDRWLWMFHRQNVDVPANTRTIPDRP